MHPPTHEHDLPSIVLQATQEDEADLTTAIVSVLLGQSIHIFSVSDTFFDPGSLVVREALAVA